MNQEKAQKFKVEQFKTRLDKYLADQLIDISRSAIQRVIERGFVSVNEIVVRESKYVVRKDDEIVYKLPKNKAISTGKKIPLKILYNNHGLLIIDKPAGLVVHPGAGFKGNSLADALLYEFKNVRVVGEEGRSGIVHRLDKDTSGVMLAALTQEMYEYLKNAFAERKIKKEYIALVQGNIALNHGFIDTSIGKSKNDFRKYSTKNIIQPKESLTEYWVLERLGPVNFPTSGATKQKLDRLDQYTLLRVKLHTGRTHQIRVHLSSLGYPLAGDKLYGQKKIALPHLTRQFLHAHRIEVQLPDNIWIEAESRLPEDLRRVLEQLGSKKVQQL